MAKRVLVVEDDPDIVELLDHYLSKDGWTVESADDGKQGLRRALSDPYDLLILDHSAEGMEAEVGVESTLGKGSRFTLTLPADGRNRLARGGAGPR